MKKTIRNNDLQDHTDEVNHKMTLGRSIEVPEPQWFYPLQKKVNQWIRERYTHAEWQYQDVCEDRMYENVRVWNEDDGEIRPQSITYMQIVYTKGFKNLAVIYHGNKSIVEE